MLTAANSDEAEGTEPTRVNFATQTLRGMARTVYAPRGKNYVENDKNAWTADSTTS
jgi:hypothetical protein